MSKVLFFSIFFLLALVSCHKLCTPHQYRLVGGTSNIYPDIDSIRVGDTLLFSSSIPINLKYSQANNSDSMNYNLSGATNIRTDFHITSPLGINMQVGAIDSFSFIPIKGGLQLNQLIPDAGKTISYLEEGSNYIVSFEIVAQKKGIYFFSIIDVYQAEKKCDKASVVIIMNDIDNHLHYLKDTYFGGQPINSLDSTHSYCFKVY